MGHDACDVFELRAINETTPPPFRDSGHKAGMVYGTSGKRWIVNCAQFKNPVQAALPVRGSHGLGHGRQAVVSMFWGGRCHATGQDNQRGINRPVSPLAQGRMTLDAL